MHMELHNFISVGRNISLIWTPSHCGMGGNELADKEAKRVSLGTLEFICIPYTDWISVIKEKMDVIWKQRWDLERKHLHDIKPDIGCWKSQYRDRRLEVVINRLRLGHSTLTLREMYR